MADRVTSRASLRLPAIQHPSAKLGDPETLSLLGRSTYSPAGRESFHPGLGGASSRSFRRSPPDGGSCAQVVSAPDPRTTTLPVFGQKKTPKSRAGSSIVASSSCYGAQLRIKVEQLEHELRKKTQSAGSLALMGIFKNNNPEGKAVVSRDVLLVVLTKFLGRQITMKQFRHLLLRLHLSEKPAIGFEELCGALREPVLASPRAMRASHVLSLLRGPTTSRFLELTECVASNESNRPGWIVAPKLRNILEQLDIYMDDREFHKLWERFDSGGTGAVQLSVLLNKLGRTDRNCVEDEHENVAQQTAANAEHSERKTISVEPRVLSNAEEERRTSIAVETWLKDRLREGVQKMRMEFEKLDATCSGKVTPHEFLQILNSFDLHLKPMQLSLFLARCGLELRKSGVDYPEFLRRFQDRSEDGVLHRILSDPKHRFHKEENISHTSSITAVETRLAKLFQSEYLSLLQAFKGIDKFNKKTVSREEFRAVVESRRGVSSLFHSRTPISCGNRDNSDDDGIQNLEESTGKARECRTVRQLFCIIKGLVRSHYQAVEKVFEELDEQNTRRLTQEMMYQLLKRFDIRPEVSRGQIRQLWSTLMTQHDGTVDFLQFVRHFGPSLKSSRFPNAKVCPPKQGDDNLRRRSNKLNCVFDILANTVRAKV
ncbi:EF-hand calcium-binding domain-containing protein 6-like [Denticeps clupeoides]|uniref:EF-hand calcium-binding domain-containing protein 6-like n=1 Tax=Denticeps clupeoides TaxID=299321 RepID=UPI0010A2CD7E|nr:EF-hand calcium-binding domain-containing protein 6-like [Denticeps clupeoides]